MSGATDCNQTKHGSNECADGHDATDQLHHAAATSYPATAVDGTMEFDSALSPTTAANTTHATDGR
jgi:phosphotransacetylase